MKPLLRRRGFGGFPFAQAQAAFNYNAIKLILIGRPLWHLPATQSARLVSLMSLRLVAPFRARFGYELLKGSGMIEASPAFSLKLAMPTRGAGADTILGVSSERSGGRLLLGVAIRRLKPDLPGSNLVAGYLCGDVQTKFRQGWYMTGDMVRINEEEFLILEERVDGFFKTGSDIVSRAALVQAITSPPPREVAQNYTNGVPSLEKGEELVLLTALSVSRETRRRALTNYAVPDPQIPPTIVQVAQLLARAFGKIDPAACLKVGEASVTVR
jgi:acyl-CoA synthetase (AMP-forming)/AMP-acid ligase II